MSELLEAGIHWSLFNFTAFVVVLFFILRKPVKEYWAARANEIRFAITEAARLRDEAKGRYDELRKRITGLEMESRQLIREMEQTGEMEKKGIMEHANAAALRIREDSERILVQEIQKARETLKEETVRHAIALAERIIADNLRATDQRKLAEQYLDRLEGASV